MTTTAAAFPMVSPFPLHWPLGQERTKPHALKAGSFKVNSFGNVRDRMLAELGRFGAQGIVVTSNVRTRPDGLPYANEREPADPGVAVYFVRRCADHERRPYVIACDTFDKVWKNMRAVHLTVAHLRGIERYAAAQLMERAATGFLALPPAREADPPWHEVLCVSPTDALDVVKASRDALAAQHHPDRGGDAAKMAQINRAWERAQAERAA